MVSDNHEQKSIFVGKGAVVEAKYITPDLPKYKDNPLEEALPRINTRIQAVNGMQRFPKYHQKMRNLPAHKRTHMVMDIQHFYQPLPVHLRLEGMVSRVIRDGYLSRNPIDPAYSGSLRERLEFFKSKQSSECQFKPTAASFFIVGMSGVGKSTGMLSVLSMTPQVIVHSNYKGRNFTKLQIVWLRLECPQDGGSTIGLCLDFFKTVDDILGTNYYKDYGSKARNADEMLLFMAVVVANHYIGLMVIDEIQNLSRAKGGGATQILNFFVKLINTLNLPVVLIGTYKAIPILSSEFRLARRGSGQGDLVWDRMEFNDDWHLYAESLWDLQYVKDECPLTTELSQALHDVSYGIPDIANKIYMAAQWRAIDTGVDTGVERITKDLLASAYRDDFRLVNHILELLKSGNIAPLPNLLDVYPPAAMPVLLTSTQSDDGRSESVPPVSSTGVESTLSPPAETEQTMSFGGRDQIALTTPKVRKARKSSAASFKLDDLRGIISRGAEEDPQVNPYLALMRASYIKSTEEFLKGA
jgi:hypothetical protein